ncbi:MAG TPA: tRNA (adenosine(37)-N6)-threonylcarbamoyltransferase complex dimerization subunit type 1 TsaB [Candidatus Solibacter sp.]|nr:tRNA (adenosine(37)-N6)-threonylcarbamoyltransferase complex dimerization subunit type 1 TsaB [Candidatus Solibacter sp.]
MLLLLCDTSGKNGFVALARAEDAEGAEPIDVIETDVIEEVPLAGGAFSAELVPQIAAMLARHGLGKHDIAAFVVISGPGSFTGLRVGLAAIKALAEILQKPIVPVSLLEAVALRSAATGTVMAALDAGRGEVYAGEYEVSAHAAQLIREQLLSKEEFLSTAAASKISTPDEVVAAIAQGAGIAVTLVKRPDAAVVAARGLARLRAGQTVSPEQLEANYIRHTAAEIFAKPPSGT